MTAFEHNDEWYIACDWFHPEPRRVGRHLWHDECDVDEVVAATLPLASDAATKAGWQTALLVSVDAGGRPITRERHYCPAHKEKEW